jgi:hypothetical protein
VIDGPRRLAISDPRNYAFFDGLTREPRVWFYRDPYTGQYELYGAPGAHPGTGAPLTPVNAAVRQDVIRLHERGEAERRAEDERRVADEAERRAREWRDRYLNPGASSQPGRTEVATLVVGRALPADLQREVTAALRAHGRAPVESLFTPDFAATGMARSLASGDWKALDPLRLTDRVDAVLIMQPKLTTAANSGLGGILTAVLDVDLKCVQVVDRRDCGSRHLNERGPGFSADAATRVAVERMLPQLRSAIAEMQF